MTAVLSLPAVMFDEKMNSIPKQVGQSRDRTCAVENATFRWSVTDVS